MTAASLRLSICIATYRRADFIGETLASIVPQLTAETELLVFDGASPDDTAAVVGRFAARDARVRYVRADTNSGVDADFDTAVGLCRGAHVWLFADDDIILPGAVAAVLAELAGSDPDVLVVDAEVRDVVLQRRFEPCRLKLSESRRYDGAATDQFLADAGNALSFIGCAIVRRSLWLARDRQRYYGSLFVHVGVIFQRPLDRAAILARPLVAIRMGNAMWGPKAYDIWMFDWPALIWSFDGFSDAAKRRVVARAPWRDPEQLLLYRAYGSFGRAGLERLVAAGAGRRTRLAARILLLTPGVLAHVAMTTIFAISRGRGNSNVYNLLVASRYSNPVSRWLGRLAGHRGLRPVAARRR